MKKVISFVINTECGDHFHWLLDDLEVDKIKELFGYDEPMFYGCSIDYGLIGYTDEEHHEIRTYLEQYMEDSWDFC